MFSTFTQVLRDHGLPEKGIWVLNKAIPDFPASTCRVRARPLRT